MVPTPNALDGLFERIEKEAEATCLYKRMIYVFYLWLAIPFGFPVRLPV